VFHGTDAQVGDAIERINGERFADFGAFHDALAEYSDEAITFSLLRRDTEEAYGLTVKPEFARRVGAVQVLGVLENSPAAKAGMLPGDLVTQINHVSIPSSGDPAGKLKKATREAEGSPLPLTVYREHEDGSAEIIQLVVTPRVDPPEGEGRLGIAIRSQFGSGEGTRFANAGYINASVPQSLPDAISYGLRTTGETFSVIASIPGRILDGSLSGKDARPISIIGISKIGGEFLQRSLHEGPSLMLHFVALISIFLGISNLLPIPALDGGRIIFVLFEMLRGKPVDPKIEARVHQVGIVLLLILGSLVMIYDLISPPSIS
jgi:regulator of sigma E protease